MKAFGMFSCKKEKCSRIVQNKRKRAKQIGEGNAWANQEGSEIYTHYPAPGEVKVSK